MGRFLRGSLGLLVVLLIHGCANHVSVDYDRAINFREYKTYVLLAKSEKSTEDTRLNSPFIDKRIATALENELKIKGFDLNPGNPDLHVRYQINLKQEVASDTSGVSMMLGSGMGRTGFGMGFNVPHNDVESYEKCMLTIDVIAAKTEQVIWRGTSMRRISETYTATELDTFFKGFVKEILVKFPPLNE
ncbi:MAG: DUF4136 domain-containing protein [Proteobacteria bacterium]|nr:DUF4136 domain-containing protein [Pseudomonadota bacterium]MBU1639802.1 DUF4136 domain-containing protein [Pseudomonadota bacterium]